MLDVEFLRGLGIREEFLPSQSNPQNDSSEDADSHLELAIAGNNGFPAELLNLDKKELRKLLMEQHTQEDPYVYLMPNGTHKVAVYPEKALNQYDLEYTAKEFIIFISLAGKAKMETYRTREGHRYYMQANRS